MQPEQVQFLVSFYLQSLDNEFKITAKVVGAVPDDKGSYRPDPLSRTAIELAWHIVFTDVWFLKGIRNGAFPFEGEAMPEDVKSIADMVAWYQKAVADGVANVKAMTAEELSKPVDFFGMMTMPVGLYISFLNNHMVHHRGQLATYLRPMGAKVPSIYGGSADEPMM